MSFSQHPLILDGNPSGPLAPAQSGLQYGALVLHGFTSGPYSMSPWSHALADAGVRVRTPLLPGHGTRWQDLNTVDASEYRSAVADELVRLSSGPGQLDRVVVCGLSMGGVLALDAAAHVDVDHVFLVNPGLKLRPLQQVSSWFTPLLRHIVPAVGPIANDINKPGVTEHAYPATPVGAVEQLTRLIHHVTPLISHVVAPVTLYRSAEDAIVSDKIIDILRTSLTPDQLRIVPLENSRHVATLDYDAELIHRDSIDTMLSLATDTTPRHLYDPHSL